MKRILFTVVALLGLFLQMETIAQITVTEPGPGIGQMFVCTQGTFSLQIAKNAGTFSPTDSIQIDIALPPDIFLGDTAYASNPGITLTIDSSDRNAPHYVLHNLSGGSFTFFYTAKPSCDYFRQSTTTAQANVISPTYNANPQPTFSTSSYTVSSAWLVFSAAGSLRLNYNLAHYAVPFTRTFRYVNTSNVPFTGDFSFTDTAQYNLNTAGIRLQGIQVTYPGSGVYTTLGSSVSDTTVSIQGRISGLPAGDSIVVQETVLLVKCPVAFDNSVSRFFLRYGCAGDNPLCRDISNFQTSAAFDPNDKPYAKFEWLNPQYLCPADNDTLVWRIKNIGQGFADTAFFQLNNGLTINHLSYYDTADVKAFKRVGNIETPVGYVVKYIDNYGTQLVPGSPGSYKIGTTQPLAPGDSIFFRWVEKKVCLDSSNYAFNDPYYMAGINPFGGLGHPCFPTGMWNADYWRSPWGKPGSKFALKQVFENLNGSMGRDEETWFRIDNRTPLEFNSFHPYFLTELMMAHPDSVEFQVELVLEAGLGLVGDSIFLSSFQNGLDTFLIPVAVQYYPGDNVNRGTGDRAVVRFRFPSYFFKPNVGGAYSNEGAIWAESAAFNRFFNRFKVNFKLHAYCEYVEPSSIATIEERTYLVYDVSCDPECRIPLSKVSDDINIHCPGCILPGWNLSAFHLQRTNFGFRDNNNNNYPDQYPLQAADLNYAKDYRIMVGDTVLASLQGATSDGQDLTFANIGFDFTEGQLRIQGALLDNLRFIGATGTYKKGNITQSFTIPASAGTINAGVFLASLSIADLYNYGLSPSFITKMEYLDEITIDPKFVVQDNLINGSGGDPYFSTESLNAWVYMSGNPITPSMPDANLDVAYLRDSLTGPQRAQYFYWCTGWDARITGIGFAFNHSTVLHSYDGIWGVTGLDFCKKKIRMQSMTDLGEPHSSTFWEHDMANQAALNSFSFEYRQLCRMDSLSFTVPSAYYVDKVDFFFSNVMLDTNTNNTGYTCAPDWYTPYAYPPGDMQVIDSTFTIYPSHFFQNLTQAPPACGSTQLAVGDETKRVFVNLVLKMVDPKHIPEDYSFGAGYPSKAYLSRFPGTLTGDTIVQRSFAPGEALTNPKAELSAQPVPTILNTNSSSLMWNLNMGVLPHAGSYIQTVASSIAPNTFLSFVSPSGAIVVDSVAWPAYPSSVSQVDSVDGRPLWGLGQLGSTTYQLQFFANYNCADVLGLDSLYVIFGWNCYEYPDTLDEACFIDTVVVYVNPEVAGLQTQLDVQDTVNACDTLDYRLELKATGSGNLQHVNIALDLPPGGELVYLPGTSTVQFGSNTMSLEPVTDTTGTAWHLDSVAFLTNAFNGAAPAAYLNFSLRAGCGFNTEEAALDITAQNYCGREIGPIHMERKPNVILGLPELDSLRINAQITPSIACNDSALVTLIVRNEGNGPTGPSNSLTVDLPSPLVFSSGTPYSSISGTQLTWSLAGNLPVNAADTIQFYITGGQGLPCGTVDLEVMARSRREYYCDTTLCSIEENMDAEVLTLTIEKAQLSLANLNLAGLCNTNGGQLSVEVENTGGATGENIAVSFYCLDTVMGVPTLGCLLATGTIAQIPANGTVVFTQTLGMPCGTCHSVIAIAEGTGCICGPDSLAGSEPCTNPCNNNAPLVVSLSSPLNEWGYNVSNCCGENGSGGHHGSGGSGSGSNTGGHGSDGSGSGGGHGSGSNGGHSSGHGSNSRNGDGSGGHQNGSGGGNGGSGSGSGNHGSGHQNGSGNGNGGSGSGGSGSGSGNGESDCGHDGCITATVTGGCAPYTFQWSNSTTVTTATQCGLTPGVYTVTVTDGTGQTVTQTITITQSPALLVEAGANQVVYPAYAPQACVTLTGSVSGGSPAYTRQWRLRNGTVLGTANTLTVCPTVNTAYFFRVTDAQGCTAMDSVLVCARNITCNQNRIAICHRPPSSNYPNQNQCVTVAQVSAHLQHGDYLGTCGNNAPCVWPNCNTKAADTDGGLHPSTDWVVETFPNPTRDKVSVALTCMGCNEMGIYTVKLTDLLGHVLSSQVLKVQAGEGSLHLDLSGLAAGTYMVSVDDGKRRVVQRVVRE